MWHVDPLLGNDRETRNYTTAIAVYLTQDGYQWRVILNMLINLRNSTAKKNLDHLDDY
jgi:hypothetical protein